MFNLPYDLHYTADHTWVSEEDDDLLAMGVTEAFTSLYGEPEDIEFTATEGQSLEAGDLLGRVVSETDEVEIYAPLTGQVIEFNIDLVDSPEVLIDSPYSQGWLVRMKPDEAEDLAALMTVEDYEGLVHDLGDHDLDEDDLDEELDLDLDDDELELDEDERMVEEEDF